MQRINCSITDCLHAVELMRTGLLQDPNRDMRVYSELRQNMAEFGWMNLIVGRVDEPAEIWICPPCQELIKKAIEARKD